jgi:1-acyl-sn-glycerol-3-phosphate acyltransferase
MAKIELLNNAFLRWFAYLFNVIPVKRGKQDMYAMKQSLQALNQGDALGIFPEGTTNGLAKKVKVKTGTAYMALRTGSKVLPVGIKTTKTNRVIVNIGKTLNYNEQKEKNPDKEKLEETTKEIMDTIIMLTETAK